MCLSSSVIGRSTRQGTPTGDPDSHHAREPHIRVNGVLCRRKTAVRPHENMVPEPDVRPVLDDQIVIGIEEISHRDMVAVVTPEGRRDDGIPSHAAQQFFKNVPQGLALVWADLIVGVAQRLALPYFGLVGGVVAPLKETVGRYDRFFVHVALLLSV